MKSKICLLAICASLAAPAAALAEGAPGHGKPAPGRAQAAAPRGLASAAGGGEVEVRGQSRSLSMMLVLKNGKEGINFIKVRKDYSAEISNTSF